MKLLVGVGLMAGGERALSGVAVGRASWPASRSRSCWRRGGSAGESYVPFGPFLIIGALWAVLIRHVTPGAAVDADRSRPRTRSHSR